MNKTTIWQRLGAMLMAMALVLGMLPVSARAAEEGWAIGDASRLSVKLTRRAVGSEYQYSVSFVTGNVAKNAAAYYWCDSMGAASLDKGDEEIYVAYRTTTGTGTDEDPYKYVFDTTKSTHTSANKDVGLKVVVDGLWVKVTIPESAAQVDLDTDLTDDIKDMGWRYTATWAIKTTLPESVQTGVPFAVTWEYMCAEEQGTAADGKYMSCGVEDSAAAISFEDSWNATVNQMNDGRYVMEEKPSGKLTLTRVVKAGLGSAKRGTETRSASAVNTAFENVQFNGVAAEAGKITYVTSEDITLSVKCAVEDAAYMPVLGDNLTWSRGENDIWTAMVPAGSYKLGDATYMVVADTVEVAFSGKPVAYVDDGRTYVEFELQEEPKSGIKSVLLDGKAVVKQNDGRWMIDEELSGELTLAVTSNVDSQISRSLEVIPALEVTVEPKTPPRDGYTGDDELTVKASYSGTLEIGNDTIVVTEPEHAIQGDVAKYSGQKWTYTDDLGRVVKGNISAYTVDIEAPSITISETDLSGFRAEQTTIKVSIEDTGSGVASAEVKYTLNDGVGQRTAALNDKNEASIVLTNEQELMQISVLAVDKMGNEADKKLSGSLTVDTTAPEIGLSISAVTDGAANAITGTFMKAGNMWLVLESPVESTAEASTTFSIHAEATDNLGMTNMDGWTNEDGTWKKDITVATVANHTEGSITLSVPVVKDNAGNYPASLTLSIGTNQSLTLGLNGDKTAYEAELYIDRRYPGDGNGIPTVTFETEATPKETLENDVKLYNEENLIFHVQVKDNGSGLANATLALDQDYNVNFLNGKTSREGDKYSITLVSVENVQGEDNQLKIVLAVSDKVGNKYTYHHIFAFDNLAPRMTFSFDEEYKHKDGGAYYFNKDVTATVTVDELNFVSDNTKVEHSGFDLSQSGNTYTVKFETEGENKLFASSVDLAGNDSKKLTHEIGETFIVDKGAPVILVKQTTKDPNGAKDNGDIHYYNGAVTYQFEIADDYLTNDGGSAEIEYTINGVTTKKTLSDLQANKGNTVYSHSFTLEDGQTLTALSVYAMDNAGNTFVRHSSSNVAFGEDGVANIGTIVVDTTAPVVTITKNAEPANTSVKYYDLYNGEVTYSISIADTNLDVQSTGAVYTGTYTYINADGSAPENDPEIIWENPYEGTFTVKEGQRLTFASLTIADAAGNMPVAVDNEQWEAAGGIVTYDGNNVVVDTTAPKAELSFESLTEGVELKGYYTNGSVAYLRLSQPISDDNKDREELETVQVKVILTVTDNNLSIAEGITNALAQVDDWVLSCSPDATVINNSNAKAVYTRTLEVKTNETMAVDMDFQIQDLVNNLLTNDNTSVAKINETIPVENFLNVTEGKMTGTITLDRRQITSLDTENPGIKLTTKATAAHTMSDGNALYNIDNIPTYALEVQDGAEGEDKEHSGLHSVKTEDAAQDFLTVDNVDEIFEDSYVRTYSDEIEVAQNGEALGEQNDASITVEAEDNVGNKITHQKTFGVDILAPRVTVTLDPEPVKNGENYYSDKRVTATVTIDDLNYAGATINNNGTEVELNAGTTTWNTLFSGGGVYTISASAFDLAGNETIDAVSAIGASFVMDEKPPTIQVIQNTKDSDGAKSNKNNTHYFNGETSYKITIADANLTETDGGVASISYKKNDKLITVPLKDMLFMENSYSHTIELGNGDILRELSITATDNAGNSSKTIDATDTVLSFGEENKCVDTVIVDMTPPVVTIEKTVYDPVKKDFEPSDPVNTSVKYYDLYNGEVTYSISVADTNLDADSDGASHVYEYTYTVTDRNIPESTVTINDGYQQSFTITEAQRMTGVKLVVTDAAGNEAVLPNGGIKNWEVNAEDSAVIDYTGNNVVVDATAPKAELSFESLTDGVELDEYYANGNVAYLRIEPATDDDNKDSEEFKTVQVKAILTITDNNLSVAEGVTNTLAQVEGWELTGSPDATVINNSNAKAVYTRTLEVKTNETMAVDMDFQIQDLVNLPLEDVTIKTVNGTTIWQAGDYDKFVKVEEGKLTGTITLDRRQPTTGDDTKAPYIELTTETEAAAMLGEKSLYNVPDLTFNLKVNDGAEVKENAGLKTVTWAVTADSSFITPHTDNANTEYKSYELSYDKNISMAIGNGEQNDVKIIVNAKDNVGNHITRVEPFAVDTLAPRVTVTCEENDVLNERYFKEARVAKITVKELNFDESRTIITSDGGGTISGWTHDADGITHTATVSYTTDGTYSLSVKATDLAGNTTGDADVNYNGMTCRKDFVVDLTMPEIRVGFNPAKESGMHNGVLFYNELQNVTVTIDELNFDVQGLTTEFPNGYTLSNFDSDDISHSAHVTFDNGNNYKFTVEFEDLAGNIAEAYTSPTFSVDCNAPVIEILKANVSQDHLQPVGDDLELVIQVTDDEHNLAECNLVLTHVNNAFDKTVVSGETYYSRASADEEESVTFTFKDFPYEKVFDGIYTVELEARDYASNYAKLAPSIQFSMNRFGSTFAYADEFTKNFLTAGDDGIAYHNKVEGNLMIQEINPTRVYSDDTKVHEGSSVTMVVNGQSTLLVQDQDYKLTVKEFGEAGSKWYVYTYEIYRDVFADGKDLINGRYSIVLYGVDEAGNNNTNTLETVDGDQFYTSRVEFVLDTIAPVIITTGIESGKIYDAVNKQMEIEIADSTPSIIQVSVNGQVIALSSKDDVLADDTVWLVQDETTGIYTLNVTEQNTLFGAQEVQIKALDGAKNESEAEVTDFTITTNWFVRYVNSGLLLILLAALAGIVLLIVIRSKKKAAA